MKLRTSPRRLQSPPSESGFSLNLTRDKIVPYKEWSSIPEKDFYWKHSSSGVRDVKRIEKLLKTIIKTVSDEYYDLFGRCFIPVTLDVDMEEQKVYLGMFLSASNRQLKLDHPPTISRIEKCFEPGATLMACTVGVYDKGHGVLLIVNNFNQTLELYDPNGSEYHIAEFQHKVISSLDIFFTEIAIKKGIKPYTFLPIEETSLNFGLNYTSSDGSYFDIGMCALLTLYFAHLRAKYLDLFPTANDFRIQILTRAYNLFKENPVNIVDHMHGYILDYISYIEGRIE